MAKRLNLQTGVIPSASLSRTLSPVLPPNFISRKEILADVAIDRAGITLIVAPAGYGKTSLAAEYVASLNYPVIWFTIDDSDDEKSFAAHFMQAARNALPDFGNWYLPDDDLSASVFLTKMLSELGKIESHLVLVLDNNRIENPVATPYASQFLTAVPSNIHTISLRREVPTDVMVSLRSLPNFTMIEKHQLEFTEAEIAVAASLKGIDIAEIPAKETLKQAYGWPAAIQLILNNISRGQQFSPNSSMIVGSSEQLKYLVGDLLSSLNESDRQMLEALAAVEEFSVEVAEVILQENYSFGKISSFATEALFLKHTADPVNVFAFNSVVRAGLSIAPTISQIKLQEIHQRLSHYFAARESYLKALEHAKLSGDQSGYRQMFRQGMRQLIAIGRGKELLRLAELVGDTSPTGKLKRQTVELMGYTADFQYENAQSLIAEMQFSVRGTELEDFIKKFNAAVSVYIDFATGLTENLVENVSTILGASPKELDLAAIDKITILKVAAGKEIIYDSSDKIIEIQEHAIKLAGTSSDSLTLYCLSVIDASVLLYKGEFKDALRIANIAIALADREGYVGIVGPIDAMYIKARCLLEFSQVEESHRVFAQIKNFAENWKQYTWIYVAESFLARDLALSGNSTSALEIVRAERDRAAALSFKNGLDVYCDLTELFIRYTMKDWDRVGVLISRVPNFLSAERIRAIHEFETGKKPALNIVANLPERTPKDQMYKYMSTASESIDREAVALEAMRKALEVGARVGAKETFLRQDATILNLIIRIAGEKPTVYLEDLASRITTRLKSRSENLVGLTAALTKRELEILRHLATGIPISAIALTLHVSQNTMKTHLKNIYRKIGAGGREEAVAKAKSLYIL